MELFKHANHRNAKYLTWLRKQKCIVTGDKAECAHHIRLGTNGGVSIKPSDYFCVPLLNEYHTVGSDALHRIGEETFLKRFNINKKPVFISYLKGFLADEYQMLIELDEIGEEANIALLIDLIEARTKKVNSTTKKKASKKETNDPPKKSLKDDEHYQKSKEIKRALDKALRDKLKKKKSENTRPKIKTKVINKSKSIKGDEFYEKSKEMKRQKDKEMRALLKEQKKKTLPQSVAKKNDDYYERAKELKKQQDREYRLKNKEKISQMRKEQREKLKELRENT